MKRLLKENKYFQIGLTALVVISLSIIIGFILFNYKEVLSLFGSFLTILAPFIGGFIFAYLLNPVVKFFKERVVCRFVKGNDRAINNISVLFTVLLFVIIIVILFSIIIPDLLKSVETLVLNLPKYFEDIKNYLLEKVKTAESKSVVVNNYEVINNYLNNVVNANLLPKIETWLSSLSSGVIGAIKSVFNIFLGFVISIYYLADKDNFIGGIKKITYAILPVNKANKLIENVRHTDLIFSNFIVGKLLDSLIIGFITFIFLAILGYPYALLIAVLIGVTNIIPYFGPFIGAIPSALLILINTNPTKCLIFVIFIIILQQFDGYLIGPKLCGNKTGLKSFWVLASITIFGSIFGIVGMLAGVPVFAIIYGYLDNVITNKLDKKSLPTKNIDYQNLERINTKTKKKVEVNL